MIALKVMKTVKLVLDESTDLPNLELTPTCITNTDLSDFVLASGIIRWPYRVCDEFLCIRTIVVL